jgi:hypothetical protein
MAMKDNPNSPVYWFLAGVAVLALLYVLRDASIMRMGIAFVAFWGVVGLFAIFTDLIWNLPFLRKHDTLDQTLLDAAIGSNKEKRSEPPDQSDP